MTATVHLHSTSREEDGALAALGDLARVVPDWERCRVVGGHMVVVHEALAGAATRHRPTLDADLVAPVAVLADEGFAQRLAALGYTSVDGSRLSRPTAHGRAVLDLLAPAPASRALHNQPAGRFRVDRFPGLQYALDEPPVIVDVAAAPLEDDPLGPYRIAVPTITAALVVKSLAARSRTKDKGDVARLLVAADLTGDALPAPPYTNLDIGSAAQYLHGPFLSSAPQQVRALVDRVVPRPPPRPVFANL